MKGHHGGESGSCTDTPCRSSRSSHSAKRAADAVTEALRALNRADLHTPSRAIGPADDALSGGQRNRTHGRHPPCRCYLGSQVTAGSWASLQLAYGCPPSDETGVRHCASSTWCPGSSRREELVCRARRVLIEDVLLLTALLARWQPIQRAPEARCFLWHTPHETPLGFQ